MHVFVGGMPRSGSTFTFGAVRDALTSTGAVQFETANTLTNFNHLPERDHLLVKGHALSDHEVESALDNGVKFVVSVRRPEDAVASWMETFNFSITDSIDAFNQWARMYKKIDRNILVIPYDAIDKHPFQVIYNIHLFLNGRVRPLIAWRSWKALRKKAVKQRTDRLSKSSDETVNLGFSYYEKDTFFHRRHVRSLRSQSAEDVLSADELLIVRRELIPINVPDRIERIPS